MLKVCPKCANDMEIGKAIKHKDFDPHERTCRCFPHTQPIISSDTLEMFDCWKCIKCGHSEELDE